MSNILPSQLEGVVSDNIEQDPSEDIEDSENEGLIDEEFYNDDSNVTEDDLNALSDQSLTQIPRRGIYLTSTQLDELQEVRATSMSPELLSQNPRYAGANDDFDDI